MADHARPRLPSLPAIIAPLACTPLPGVRPAKGGNLGPVQAKI